MRFAIATLTGLTLFLGVGWYVVQRRPADAPAPAADLSPGRSDASASWLKDVTSAWGVDFTHTAGGAERYFMPAHVGSGAALFDFDNDGRLDLFLMQNGGPDSQSGNRLYRQSPDGRFQDVTAGSGLEFAANGMGVAAGDVTNDGWVDLVVTEFSGVRLFLNGGDGTFADATRDAGLDNPQWGTSAAFLDYDRDGWLDLVIANYVDYDPQTVCDDRGGRVDFCGPSTFSGTVSRLFHHLGLGADGQSPRFEDVTVRSGLGSRQGPGLGVLCADLTGDQWTDILVANDGAANHLWVNQRDGTFTEEGVLRGLAYDGMGQPQANMGIAVGDVDGDGLQDVFVTHLQYELHVIWKQGPAGAFQDATGRSGLATPRWRSTGFGALFADFDQDGDLDLALANGAVKRPGGAPPATDAADFWEPYFDRNQLFANDGQGRFRDASEINPDFCGARGVARGLAVGDIDGDGALDLVETRIAAPARVFRNVSAPRGHWLLVRAVDPQRGGRDMYGAEITVRTADRQWTRLVNPGYSYLCSNSPQAHFGLGDAAEVLEIEVLWPEGDRETFPGGPADRHVVLAKGASDSP